MRASLVLVTTAIFAALGTLHLYWAGGGRAGSSAAVPQIGGSAAFNPSTAATIGVALGLFAAAAVVAVAGGALRLAVPGWMSAVAASVLAAILFARAVGDFRLVGFFKSRGESRFAALDTYLYSPLCLALAASILIIILTQPVQA